MLKSLRFIWLLVFSTSYMLSFGQSFDPTADILLPLSGGHIEWADLDNDNDLDLIYAGVDGTASSFFTKVYENDNGSFVEKNTGLPDIRNGSFALGDFDDDGDLDVLLSGLSTSTTITDLYENTGGFNFSLLYSFTGLLNATPKWLDLDNDGDLDFLVTGADDVSGDPEILTFENTGAGFSSLAGTGLLPCSQCAIDVADSNGDGWVDLIVTGLGDDGLGHTSLYTNLGDGTFALDGTSTLDDAYGGDVKWGDFDNDGDMDVLLTGIGTGDVLIASIYENEDGVLRKKTNITLAPAGENWAGGTAWADVDNDGYLDIMITGRATSILVADYQFKLYHNNGDDSFTEVAVNAFQGIWDSSVSIGDYDNDGDLDIAYTGTTSAGPVSGIYENNLFSTAMMPNTVPGAPDVSGHSEQFFRNQITLLWQDGTDAETPAAGLSYNVYVENAGGPVVYPSANLSTGYLRTANPTNGQGRTARLKDIPEGDHLWRVQTIDGAYAGSTFSGDKAFHQINGPEAVKATIVNPSIVELTWIDLSSIETAYRIERSTDEITGFAIVATPPADEVMHNDNFAFLTDTYYYYRIFASDAMGDSPYDSLKVVICTPPDNLTTTPYNVSSIRLLWDDLSNFEDGYELSRKLSGEVSFTVLDTLAAGATNFLDTGLVEGTSYDYRVRALNEYGASAFSNVATGMPNYRPTGNDFPKETPEDSVLVFALSDFADAFLDADATDTLFSVVIETLPQIGTLTLAGLPVIVGQSISASEIMDLSFSPPENMNGVDAFSFFNTDGRDTSAVSYTVSLTIAAVNDPPAFTIPDLFELDEDFTDDVTIIPVVAPVPADESDQDVVYSVQPITSNTVGLSFIPTTGQLVVFPMPNVSGDVEFVIIADDGQAENNIYSDTVRIIVHSVNDPPTFTFIADLEVEVGTEIPPINFGVSDVDGPITGVTLLVSSNNQSLIKDENITIEGDDIARTMTIVAEAGAEGDVVITLTGSDGTAQSSVQFLIRIFTVTGIEESKQAAITTYPNPVTTALTVAFEDSTDFPYILQFRDVLGRQVLTRRLTTKESTIDCHELNQGVYMVIMTSASGDVAFMRRIMKE